MENNFKEIEIRKAFEYLKKLKKGINHKPAYVKLRKANFLGIKNKSNRHGNSIFKHL